MKKIMITLLSVSAALFFATAVWAGPFEHFYDYQNPDGTYIPGYGDRPSGIF